MVRIKTALELALALTYKGGAKNAIVQLLENDFQRMNDIMKFIEPTTKKFKKYVTRKNEIEFEKPSTKIECDWSNFEEVKSSFSNFGFSFTARPHSGQGLGIKFDVIMGEKPKIAPDDIGKEEIKIALGMPTRNNLLDCESDSISSDDDILFEVELDLSEVGDDDYSIDNDFSDESDVGDDVDDDSSVEDDSSIDEDSSIDNVLQPPVHPSFKKSNMLSGVNILLMPNKYLDPSTHNQTQNKSSDSKIRAKISSVKSKMRSDAKKSIL